MQNSLAGEARAPDVSDREACQQSEINRFYEEASAIFGESTGFFEDWFYNDFYTFEEMLELERNQPEVELQMIDDEGLCTFNYQESFREKVAQAKGIENPTDDDVGEYILEMLEEAYNSSPEELGEAAVEQIKKREIKMNENNDWGDYFAKAEISLRNSIECSDRLRRSDKRYSLHSKVDIIEGDFDKNTGTVSDYVDCNVSADSVEVLEEIWKKSFLIRKYSTTHPHFIFDNAEGKAVKILSMCA